MVLGWSIMQQMYFDRLQRLPRDDTIFTGTKGAENISIGTEVGVSDEEINVD